MTWGVKMIKILFILYYLKMTNSKFQNILYNYPIKLYVYFIIIYYISKSDCVYLCFNSNFISLVLAKLINLF